MSEDKNAMVEILNHHQILSITPSTARTPNAGAMSRLICLALWPQGPTDGLEPWFVGGGAAQIFTVPSWLAEAMRWPSGLNATL
jgi:hypothetical protein